MALWYTYPAGQIFWVADKLPREQKYPAEQTPEQSAEVKPDVFPWEPDAHGPVHVVEDNPALDPYKPAAHGVDTLELMGQNDLKINMKTIK